MGTPRFMLGANCTMSGARLGGRVVLGLALVLAFGARLGAAPVLGLALALGLDLDLGLALVLA